MSTDARPYPFDLAAIRKGDVIPSSELVPIIGVPVDHKDYNLGLMELATWAERELAASHRPMVVSCENGTLKFHTDESAVAYTNKQFRSGARRMVRNHRRALQIDARNLSADDRQKLNRQLVIQGAALVAQNASIAEAKRLLAIQATQGEPALT